MKSRFAKIRIRTVQDKRGKLRIFERGITLPFHLKRCFVISEVPKGNARGEHIVSCDLFISAITGTCRLTLDYKKRTKSISLSHKTSGVFVRKGTWLRLDRFSRTAIVLVCASQLFKSTRYFQLRKRANARA